MTMVGLCPEDLSEGPWAYCTVVLWSSLRLYLQDEAGYF